MTLSFHRTAGFPQYGFKAYVLDDAFLSADLLSSRVMALNGLRMMPLSP
jgi:hypothetical protein